jgi:hypothetical protein
LSLLHAGPRGEILALLPRLVSEANMARSLSMGLKPYDVGEEPPHRSWGKVPSRSASPPTGILFPPRVVHISAAAEGLADATFLQTLPRGRPCKSGCLQHWFGRDLRCPQELSSKLAAADKALTDAHGRLSSMLRANDFGNYAKLRASIDKQIEWMQTSSPVARAMLGRLQPKKVKSKQVAESLAGASAGTS